MNSWSSVIGRMHSFCFPKTQTQASHIDGPAPFLLIQSLALRDLYRNEGGAVLGGILRISGSCFVKVLAKLSKNMSQGRMRLVPCVVLQWLRLSS